MSRLLASLRLFLLLAGAGALAIRPRGAQNREYDLKAAFVFNFVQFVTWPDSAFAEANSPYVIGILGENPFGSALEDMVRGEKVNGRPLEVRKVANTKEVEECHILFVSRSEAAGLETVLWRVRAKPVLTVSEIDEFTERGGIIRLYNAGNKVRFQINAEEARAAGLRISSKLLRLAEVVTTTKRP